MEPTAVCYSSEYVCVCVLKFPPLDCANGQVRLMNGSSPSNGMEGRVEICYENIYGTICDDLWDEDAARVACGGMRGNSHQQDLQLKLLMLPFHTCVGAPLNGRDNVYGSGNGSIVLDNVVCSGNEDNLLLCAHNNIFENNCDHLEDAAVVCGSE